jgi:23S rRNA (adenine2503-C2)-methyltransferase
VNLLTLPLPELESIIKSWGFPAFRARQINNWIFNQGVSDIDDMTDLPLKLRTVLKERATIGSLHLEIEQVSNDGTRKRAYKLHDGQMIESVLMPYEDGRRTACISSQAGCAMGECNLLWDQTEYQATELMINEELPTCRDRRRNALISFIA